MLKKFIVVMLMTAALIIDGTLLAGAAVRDHDTDFEQDLYLEVTLNERPLTQQMRFKERNGILYVNLKQISRLLESPISNQMETTSTLESLEKLFQAKFEYVENLQQVSISGNGQLQIEKRWAREAKYAWLNGYGAKEAPPVVELEPTLIGKPSLDVSMRNLHRFGHQDSNNFTYSYKGGLEAFSGTAYVFGRGYQSEYFSDFRFSWEKFEPGYFVKGGDVVAPPVELIANAEGGRGLNFSTFPIELSSQFATDTLSGDLLDGWVVELYRGKVLLDVKRSDGTGRYFFRDLPLLRGLNDITLKFYGPQGQIRVETKRIRIGRGMAPKGKLWTRISLTEQGERLTGGRYLQIPATVEGYRGTAEAFYGVSDSLTLTSSISSIDTQTDIQGVVHYAKAGFRTSIFESALRFDFLMDDNDGWGIQASLLTQAFGWNVQLDSVDFYDIWTDKESNMESRRKIRLFQYFGGVSIDLSAEKETRRLSNDFYEYQARIAGNFHGVSLSHVTTANLISQENSDWVRNRFLMSGRLSPKFYLRGSVDYEVDPNVEFRTLGAALDYIYSETVTLRTNFVQNMLGDKVHNISQSVLWNGDHLGLGVSFNYGSDGNYQVFASASFSFSPDEKGSYRVQRLPSSNIGTVNIRVFLDRNENGKYNKGKDLLLSDVGLKRNEVLSSDRGIIPFKGAAYRLAHIEIDEMTLPDPYMVSAAAVAVYLRPTHINTLNIPVWETGDVEGSADPGETVQLLYKGKVVAETVADYDGYFLFEKARFKSYIVRSGDKKQRVYLNREHLLAYVELTEGTKVSSVKP